MALPRANGSKYDVFLSFRGEDTRHSFTDHLYAALVQAGILTFRDSDDAERGEELKQEIENAIKTSDASIIVLSGGYATSTWCLDELSLILDQRRDRNHFVLPVFYHVDPSHVGKQEGSFMIAANSSRRWTDDNVKRWKAALTEVVSVIGMSLVGSETKFIKEVVDTIYNRLDRKQIYLPHNITAMDAQYAEITSWLRQYENQFLVIYGMAGSGKSTLARYIVNSNCQHFESYSIVESIDSKCQKPYEIVTLQQQLCDDISKGKGTRIHSVCQGTSRIEVLLEKAKALIVLDDIVNVGQLDDLLGRMTINKESKIIITTHNDIISNWFMSRSNRFQKYAMRLLNDDEALELLSLHAFRSRIPKEGYMELAQQAVRYCDGSPLALEVLGSSLFSINTVTSWESELSSFEMSLHDKIFEVLKRSYKSLPSQHERELFLHIACFFVGKDMNYVVKILKPDYPAESKIETLIQRCFLYVTPDKKLMMHRLLQEMGRYLADQESRTVSERTRVWRNKDSYHMLRRKKGSSTIEGLALDIQMLMKDNNIEPSQLKELSTDSLQQMDQLKYLQLNYVKLTGSYEDLSEHIRWLCWVGFDKSTIHADILTRSIVALDMSYSCLEKFEPPVVMPSLKILNLKDSHNLLEIRGINKIPNLETLIIWNCCNLFHICGGVGNLEWLSILIMTGCKNLFKRVQTKTLVDLETSTSVEERAQELSFPLPHSLQRVLLNDCNLECTDYFPVSFRDQLFLQYINLVNGLFEILPSYNHLRDLRVLDLRKCSRLKSLICLPSTLAELYIYDCTSIEKISFESGRFTLQEFGYEGCINLSEIEGLVKLLLVAKLDETDLGHLIWLKEYQNHEVCLIGDYELTKGRSCHLQMLYEFNIMSTSLPDITHPNLMPEYRSQSTSLFFDVPACPRSSSLKGLNVTFRYTISGDDWVWFAKINTTSGVDVMYSPIVFGKPGIGQVGIWLSYWPIGNLLDVGDEVKVSIAVTSGLVVLECGASLVYAEDNVAPEVLKNKTGWVEAFGRDLSGFHLIKGSYYLCQRDIYKIMEIGRLTSGWLSILVGDTIDDTEVRGWRMTGRPQQSYQSFTELKNGRCVIRGHEMIFNMQSMDISEASVINETMEFTSSSLQEKMDPAISESSKLTTKEETGKFDDKIKILEPTTLTDRMKTASKFVSTDTETKEELYKIEELSKSSLSDKTEEYTPEFSKDSTKDADINEMMVSTSSVLAEQTEHSRSDISMMTIKREKVEAERDSVKLILDNELIRAAHIQSTEAHKHNEPYLTNNMKHVTGSSSSSMEVMIFAFKGPSEVDDWYQDDGFGHTRVDEDLFPSLQSIIEHRLANVNGAFLRIFQDLLNNRFFKQEVQKAVMVDEKNILFTGHSSGGAIASFATLWMLDEYTRKRGIKSPIGCITFGSPLIGDETLSHAVRREKWAGHFTHFVMEYDIVPRIMLSPKTSIQEHLPKILKFFQQNIKPTTSKPYKISGLFSKKTPDRTIDNDQLLKPDEAVSFFENVLINASTVATHASTVATHAHDGLMKILSDFVQVSPYRPFGGYVFCTCEKDQDPTETRQFLVVDNPKAVLQLLFYFLQIPNEDQDRVEFAVNSLAESFSYGEELNKNGLQLQNMVHLKDLNEQLLRYDDTKDDVVHTSNKALFELDRSARMCLMAVEEDENRKKENEKRIKKSMRKYQTQTAKNKQRIIEVILDEIRNYKERTTNKNMDHYEVFKLQNNVDDFQAKVNMLELAMIYDEVIEMVMNKDLPDEFEVWDEWVDLATLYRRLVEPLEIANFYRHSMGGISYISVRPKRYKFTQRWYEHANAKGFEMISESNFIAEVEQLKREIEEPRNTKLEEIKARFESIKVQVQKWKSDDKIPNEDVYWGESALSMLEEKLS